MKLRYIVGALVGGAIGLVLSYLYSQGDNTAITSNLGVGAVVGVLVGLYIVFAASIGSLGTSEGSGESPRFG